MLLLLLGSVDNDASKKHNGMDPTNYIHIYIYIGCTKCHPQKCLVRMTVLDEIVPTCGGWAGANVKPDCKYVIMYVEKKYYMSIFSLTSSHT